MWLQYAAVDDCDAALARAKKNGGTIVTEPIDAEGVGRFGIFRDSLGAMMGVIKPAGGLTACGRYAGALYSMIFERLPVSRPRW